MSGFVTREAALADLADVLIVQQRAFRRVATELGIDPSNLPPLRETLEDLTALMVAGTRFFVAVSDDGALVGSVRGTLRDADVEVGRLVVDDGWLRRGVASALMNMLEGSYPGCGRFELFTGADARGPLLLYAARGYREYRREHVEGVELVWLERTGCSAIP